MQILYWPSRAIVCVTQEDVCDTGDPVSRQNKAFSERSGMVANPPHPAGGSRIVLGLEPLAQ